MACRPMRKRSRFALVFVLVLFPRLAAGQCYEPDLCARSTATSKWRAVSESRPFDVMPPVVGVTQQQTRHRHRLGIRPPNLS
jgi:hypothetical protein